MVFPRIQQFNFDLESSYTVPDIYTGRPDLISLQLYNNVIFYKPLCAANDIKLTFGYRAGILPNMKAYKVELKNTKFVNLNVAVATVSNISSLAGLQIIDGYTLVNGDLILVKDQIKPDANGVYIVHSGNWSKTINVLTSKSFVVVENGTVNENKGFRLAIIETPAVGYNPIYLYGPFALTEVPYYTDDEIQMGLNNYSYDRRPGDLDWNSYFDNFNGYISDIYAGRFLLVPTIESCNAWMKIFNKVQE